MYLTRTYLNPQRRGAAKLLGSPQAMHAAVLAGFAPDQSQASEQGRILWRVDGAGTPTVALYVVSPKSPDFTGLCEQAGWPTRPEWWTKPYEPVLSRLANGQRWNFRLTANPTHRARTRDGSTKIMGHVTVAQQTAWLTERSLALGFQIPVGPGDEPVLTVRDRAVRSFRREGGRVTLSVATFDGVLNVVDVEKLRRTLILGIGRARGYGCGLMTLARV